MTGFQLKLKGISIENERILIEIERIVIENVRISIETERALIESVRNSIGGFQVFNLKVENQS